MLFRQIYDETLAQAAYLIGCQRTGEALIIDPERDVERYIEAAEREGLRITAITETHIHADFLSGARELAERTGAMLYLSAEGGPDWQYQWLNGKLDGGTYRHKLLRDGDEFMVGNIKITAVHTPGHTPEHLSYLVTDLGGGASEPMGIATGDFVFVGDVGRPDLLETAAGQVGAKEPAAQVLYHSIARFMDLPEYMQVWPGHGAGSACGKALGAIPQSTVGYEKRFNAAIDQTRYGEDEFVASILAGQPEPPVYFARMKRLNKLGPAVLGATPHPTLMGAREFVNTAAAHDVIVIDTRDWNSYRALHLNGALHIPVNRAYPTVAGSFIDPDRRILLVVDEAQELEAVLSLIRVGIDNVIGMVRPEELDAHLRTTGTGRATAEITVEEFARRAGAGEGLVLDVRNASEFEAGHVVGALNIAYTRLAARAEEIPADRTLLVHCLSGARSAVAAAFLEQLGRDAIYVAGEYPQIVATGVPTAIGSGAGVEVAA